MDTLSRHDIGALCAAVNAYSTEGGVPYADRKSFWFFTVSHVRRCLLSAMADAAKHDNSVVIDGADDRRMSIQLPWDRAREIERWLYGHVLGGVRTLSDLRGQDLRITVELDFSDVTRRLIAAYNANAQRGGADNDTLASDVEPAPRKECEEFVGEMIDQKLEWIAEDLDDMPVGGE